MQSNILVELQESMGSDASISNAAWTSTYDKVKRDVRYDDEVKVADLVPRLIKDNHGTPIESVIFRFWIKMPIFCDRQHMTHRLASHNGLSGRYRTMPEEWYSMPKDVDEIFKLVGAGLESFKYESTCKQAFNNYSRQLSLLKEGQNKGEIDNIQFKRAREIIRAQLPTAGMTERTTIMNLRSFANYQRQRNSEHAQFEIREVARLMLEEVEKAKVCPIAIKTLKEINWRL